MVTQQPDLKGLLVEKRRREPLDPLAQDGAGDRSSIDLVGLARLALTAARDAHHLRRDAQDVLARAQQRPLQAARDAPAVLKRPDALGLQRARPAQRSPMAILVGSDLDLADHDAGAGVDRGERVRALVGIRSDHDHVHVPFIGLAAEADRQRTQLSRGDATLLSSHAGDPDRRRATEPKEVSHDGRQPALESARRRTRTTGTAGQRRQQHGDTETGLDTWWATLRARSSRRRPTWRAPWWMGRRSTQRVDGARARRGLHESRGPRRAGDLRRLPVDQPSSLIATARRAWPAASGCGPNPGTTRRVARGRPSAPATVRCRSRERVTGLEACALKGTQALVGHFAPGDMDPRTGPSLTCCAPRGSTSTARSAAETAH